MQSVRAILIAVILLAAGAGYAMADSFKEADALVESGQYGQAEQMLKRLISAEPKNPRNHELLGDAYRKSGRLSEALGEYETAARGGGDSAELQKKIGATHKWMRSYGKAEAAYRSALEMSPGDREAREDLASLERRKGLKLRLSSGGWEPDYTTDSYEIALSYSGIDRFDLNAGYSFADQVFYERDKLFASAYYFYNPSSYFKVYAAVKDYDYPATTAGPDANSYDVVPAIEFELSHWLRPDLRGSVAYEYFRPSFFHDTDSHASNHKVSGELYWKTPLEYLRLKAIAAVLRDPDPDRTTIKGRPTATPAASTQVEYQTQALLGGAAEYARGKWDAELKYLPNRDLDSSYDWSVLAGLGYAFTDRLTGRLDYVHDKYSTESNFSGQTADVYLVSAYYALNPSMDIGVGVKRLELPTEDKNAAFFTFTYKTGLGL